MEEGQVSSRLQYQGRIQDLEKELAQCMWVNQELNQKLSLSLWGGQGRGKGRLSGTEEKESCLLYYLLIGNLQDLPEE